MSRRCGGTHLLGPSSAHAPLVRHHHRAHCLCATRLALCAGGASTPESGVCVGPGGGEEGGGEEAGREGNESGVVEWCWDSKRDTHGRVRGHEWHGGNAHAWVTGAREAARHRPDQGCDWPRCDRQGPGPPTGLTRQPVFLDPQLLPCPAPAPLRRCSSSSPPWQPRCPSCEASGQGEHRSARRSASRALSPFCSTPACLRGVDDAQGAAQ